VDGAELLHAVCHAVIELDLHSSVGVHEQPMPRRRQR
jgi:hypothetical protein